MSQKSRAKSNSENTWTCRGTWPETWQIFLKLLVCCQAVNTGALQWQTAKESLSSILFYADFVDFTFTKRFGNRFLENVWHALTNETTPMIALLEPLLGAFLDDLVILYLVTYLEKFLGLHAFFFWEEGLFTPKLWIRSNEDHHLYKGDRRSMSKLLLKWKPQQGTEK